MNGYLYKIDNANVVIYNQSKHISYPLYSFKETITKLGLCIRSKLGESYPLLNAEKTTNFIYKIENLSLTEAQISEINAIKTNSKIKDRIEKIAKLGGRLHFTKMESSVFESNLILIDSYFPKIISECLSCFFTSNLSKTPELVNKVAEENPINYTPNEKYIFYSYKFKRFLTNIALGMMPSKVWTGQLDAKSGYLIVKEDGEVLCYHIYNRNEFEDYLFLNTKIDYPDSKPSRCDFGRIISAEEVDEPDGVFIKLNFQIRFI